MSHVAAQLWFRLEREAVTAARAFIEGCESFGDEAAARFWSDVAVQLQAMADNSDSVSGPDAAAAAPGEATSSSTWHRMIERYRHRAVQAARAAGAEARRTQMVEIAAHWFELAREAEVLAREVGER